MFVEHRADFAVDRAGDEVVADFQRSVLHQHGRDVAAASVDLGFENGAHRRQARIGFQILHVGDQQNHFEQQIQVLAGLVRKPRPSTVIAAPVFGQQALFGQFAFHAFRIDAGFVDLVDRDNDRDFCGSGVRNRFDGLRHDAVVGRDDENDDVGDPRAARAHQRERFVARCIEERDLAISCTFT